MKRLTRYNRYYRRHRKERIAASVIQNRSYRENHRATYRAAQSMKNMKQRLKVLKIIGSVCIDCRNPYKIPQVAHREEDPSKYESGKQHRLRVGRGHVIRDLLKMSKARARALCIPLCASCNQIRAEQWRKQNVTSN
jgi:hypothetical protein